MTKYPTVFFKTVQEHAKFLASAFASADAATITPPGKFAKTLHIEDRDIIVKALSTLAGDTP